MNSPLLVLLFRLGPAGDSEAYAKSLRDTFTEGGGGELLEVTEFREYKLAGPDLTGKRFDYINSADRLLIIVLDARPGSERDFEDVLVRTLPATKQQVLNVHLVEPGSLYDQNAADRGIVRLGLQDLDERDLRNAFLTLYALHLACQLLDPGHTTLFFSHAKRDGVPLTTATFDWLEKRLKNFTSFYDTNDLDLHGDIDAQLNRAVASAIVIVFRSDVFDQRYWCQKEVLWAEQHGRPVLTVDARWQIEHSPSVINFDSTPVVRIPDGSVVRIFTSALVEALRVALFKARVQNHTATLTTSRVVALPRQPSLVSLHGACEELRTKGGNAYIVYPNPSLPKLMLQSAQGLADAALPDCEVKSLDEFRLVI